MVANIAVARKSKPAKELTEKEKFCLDLILEDYTNVDAAFASGLFDPAGREDKELRKKAGAKVQRLMQTKKGSEYIRLHRKLAVAYVPTDINTVATKMMDIAMGVAKHHVKVWSESAEGWVEYDVTPVFADQIKAAEWLRKYTADQELKARYSVKTTKVIENADAVALNFVGQWQTRMIDDGKFSNANGTMTAAGRKQEELEEAVNV